MVELGENGRAVRCSIRQHLPDRDHLIGRHRLDLDRRAGMGRVDHLAVADVDPHVARRTRRAVRTGEEEQIARLRRGQAGDRRADVGLLLTGPGQGDPHLAVHVLDESRAVESRWARAAPHVGRPLELRRLCHHVRTGDTTRRGGHPTGRRGGGALLQSRGVLGRSAQVAQRGHEQRQELGFASRAPDTRGGRVERVGGRARGSERRAERGGEVGSRRIGIGGDGIGEEVAGRPQPGGLGQAGGEVVPSPVHAVDRGRGRRPRRRTDLGDAGRLLQFGHGLLDVSQRNRADGHRGPPSLVFRPVVRSSRSTASLRSSSARQRAK